MSVKILKIVADNWEQLVLKNTQTLRMDDISIKKRSLNIKINDFNITNSERKLLIEEEIELNSKKNENRTNNEWYN
jgi:hypothetical protein